MDLKIYFKALRQAEADLPTDPILITSIATPDGGKAGTVTEVPRELAARMIVDGIARTANDEEAKQYRERESALRRQAERKEANSRIQVVLVPEASEDGRKQKVRLAGPKD